MSGFGVCKCFYTHTSLRKDVFISEGSREGQIDICHLFNDRLPEVYRQASIYVFRPRSHLYIGLVMPCLESVLRDRLLKLVPIWRKTTNRGYDAHDPSNHMALTGHCRCRGLI